jgi:type II secretory pathway predicted ATPase ExeA
MTMSFVNELNDLGVDTDGALKRFMNNVGLYERMLKKFVVTAPGLEVLSYIEAGDIDKSIENSHTLKGITGNLSLTPLYEAYTDIVALLRSGDVEKAKSILVDILPVQEKIIQCIDAGE